MSSSSSSFERTLPLVALSHCYSVSTTSISTTLETFSIQQTVRTNTSLHAIEQYIYIYVARLQYKFAAIYRRSVAQSYFKFFMPGSDRATMQLVGCEWIRFTGCSKAWFFKKMYVKPVTSTR